MHLQMPSRVCLAGVFCSENTSHLVCLEMSLCIHRLSCYLSFSCPRKSGAGVALKHEEAPGCALFAVSLTCMPSSHADSESPLLCGKAKGCMWHQQWSTLSPPSHPFSLSADLMCYLRADVQLASGDDAHVIKFDNHRVNYNSVFNVQQAALSYLCPFNAVLGLCKWMKSYIFLSTLHFNLIKRNQTSARTPTHQYLI